MSSLDLSQWIVVLASAVGSAALALVVLGRMRPASRLSLESAEHFGERVVFLFQGRKLVDATPGARSLLDAGPAFLDDFARLCAVLEPRFRGATDELSALPDRQRFLQPDTETGGTLEAEWRDGITRVVVNEVEQKSSKAAQDTSTHFALVDELDTLRSVIDDAPMLIWKEDAKGAVRWANGAYVDLVQKVHPSDDPVGWPLPRVFAQRPLGLDAAIPPRRLSVTVPGDEVPIWFDSFNEPKDDETLVFALPVDKLVHAEATLREFVQTLTKTFAHLPTGLAVFDRDRRLALFNPALTDLSALEPQFLSGRPSLFEFLDHLREKRRMPEPKDYKSWRKRILEMETAAASGTHQETWSLPTGQTYRVTGRPHPDGAVAFLFEDITSEVSLTRRFRAELELGQSVIDSLEEAVVVFSATGALILTNTAYEQMWEHDPNSVLGETGVIDATRHWQERCKPTPVWGDLRDFVHTTGERAEWFAEVTQREGIKLACRFVPLSGHATMVGFSPVTDPDGAEHSAIENESPQNS